MKTLFEIQTESGQLWIDISEHLAAKDAEIATIKSTLEQLEAFRVGMVAKVSTVLQSGDPEQFAALAVDFLTPEQDKIRAEKMAQLEALKAELGIE